jgi:hypothetical protein
MPTITSTGLDILCSFLKDATYPYYPVTNSFATDLYVTGSRPSELLDSSKWVYVNDNEITLTPLKNNLPRYFKKTDLSNNLFNAIIDQVKPYNNLSLRQLEYNLYNVLPVAFVGTVAKSAIAYIFRYNYIRKLNEQGVSDADILLLMGWQNEWLPYMYYSKVILTDVPYNPVRRLANSNGDILVDSDGTFVIDRR